MNAYGYIRVSSLDQNEDRQLIEMNKLGVKTIYMDKRSGKDFERPQYKKMLKRVNEVDPFRKEDIRMLVPAFYSK